MKNLLFGLALMISGAIIVAGALIAGGAWAGGRGAGGYFYDIFEAQETILFTIIGGLIFLSGLVRSSIEINKKDINEK